ncbi:MAG: aminotransferase class I/II-fold pyridoxal phosphate-dependent enzyme [Negativicutes bacterium]|nr:aminotransferase class I/II-fold pyridoxal phosphate-dependent enzyme [Negativicutes bacterium]
MLRTEETPIIAALEKYINARTVRFHMPGHKGGRILQQNVRRLLGRRVFRADVTNIPDMDDLHQPHGAIEAAQRLAAKVFGAESTYFLVNGSSCGLQALVLAACNPGDKILVPRNIHRSILGGIILSGATPVFFVPEYDREYGIPLGTAPETIRDRLDRQPDIKAVMVVNPTYHGVISDIAAVAAVVHERGIPLLVDEAHGPHLGFHERLPANSLHCGADAVVHGTHKILAALTQGSMLHIQGNLVDRQKLETALRMLQSTSTSYLLLSSLDAARAQFESTGRQLIDKAVVLADYARKRLSEVEGVSTLSADRPGIFRLDPMKVTILVRKLGVPGFWLEERLKQGYNIQVEMSELYSLLLMISFANTRSDIDRFAAALAASATALRAGPTAAMAEISEKLLFLPLPEMILPPREAFFSPTISVPLEDSHGRVSAEVIACYPPGIPVICPGEKISAETVAYLAALRELGAHFQGCYDPSLQFVSVIA